MRQPEARRHVGVPGAAACTAAVLAAVVTHATMHHAPAQQSATVSSGQLEEVRRKLAEIESERRENELELRGRARTPWSGEVTADLDLIHRRLATVRLLHDEVSFGCVWTLDPIEVEDEQGGTSVRICLTTGHEYVRLAPGRWRIGLRAGDPASFALNFDPVEVSLRRGRAYLSQFTRREADAVSSFIRAEKKKLERADRSASTATDPIPLEPGR